MTPSFDQGVLSGQEGAILQRSGEELRLVKVPDRFTTQLVHPDRLPILQALWQPISVRAVAQGQLVEWQVNPAHLEAQLTEARSSQDVSFASHVYQLEASPQTRVYLLDQLTVQFSPDVSISAIDAIATPLGLTRYDTLTDISNTYLFQISPQATENPIKIANRLSRYPEVLLAEPNIVVETGLHYRPKDTLYKDQWHLNHGGGQQLSPNSHISVEKAWDITRGSRSVVIAVTDDAFDLNHPDLQGIGKIVAPRDLKNKDGLPMPKETYENHGTACAGLALAEETGTGIVGVAPGCSFMPIQTTGFLDDNSIDDLFNWAIEKGAAVISCSWSPAAVYFPLSLRQRAAVTRATTKGRNGKGCVVVFSAGNANRPVSGSVEEQGWPNNVLRGVIQWLGGFAVHPDVITVAACTSLNRKAVYSNWGPSITIAAPSNNAPPSMALPDVGNVATGPAIQDRFEGLGMVTCDRSSKAGYSSDDYTFGFGGTSSACPVVAGVAGLILSANPDLTAQEVKQILQDTADKIIDDSPDPQLRLNHGRYDNKGYSQWFGYGKVNAYKAVKAAQEKHLQSRQLTQSLNAKNDLAMRIPDNDRNGILSNVSLNKSGLIQDIQVTIHIDHEFLGDISITLIAPSGQNVLLQGRTLGRQTRLQTTYTLATTPALRNLLNQNAQGRWQLRVVDHAITSTGQLIQWQLVVGT
jgi:subtilisin family serine protease/subtilisin-like proprotein convertase family protein